MQNKQLFAISLPSLEPMEPLQSYIAYVSKHYKEYDKKMVGMKPDTYKDEENRGKDEHNGPQCK